MYVQNKYDVNKDFYLLRYKNGVKLIRPENIYGYSKNFIHCSVRDLLTFTIPIWFNDSASKGIITNEANASALNFVSTKDYIDKTMLDVIEKNDALRLMEEDKEAIKYSKTKIIEQSSIRKDGKFINALSIKKPWYNDDNKIIGTLGCAIVLGNNPLDKSLDILANIGFLCINDSSNTLIDREMKSVSLSKRELECLRLTIRGNTAKQIANILNLSKWTIEEYLENLKLKLNVSSKSELIEKSIDYFVSTPANMCD